MKELARRQEIISKEVWKTYAMVNQESLPFRVQGRWINWVNQVPVFGFNSGIYDLSLVKYYFIKTLSNMSNYNVAKKDIPACS